MSSGSLESELLYAIQQYRIHYPLLADNKGCRGEKGSRPTNDATQREAKLVVNSTVSNERVLRKWSRRWKHGEGRRAVARGPARTDAGGRRRWEGIERQGHLKHAAYQIGAPAKVKRTAAAGPTRSTRAAEQPCLRLDPLLRCCRSWNLWVRG
ncbi:hypothetical protein K458DRAFT_159485 [Lentithecium fluviatile CBS 122367]|uniref:Uncharacterized protein n=1 Tax=Lentithecium fluviatile CBS 122367 TaxID=1168545 RepID=A0A6G1IHS3_9PLEO|nr:hypothetical protein K458DRAFT_159485 [Lentithecium fluviatile CBS 122367]